MMKMKIKKISIIVMLLIGLFMAACQIDNNAALEKPVTYSEGNPEDFVNGYNQKYLTELGITEEQVLAKIKQQYAEEAAYGSYATSRGTTNNVVDSILSNMTQYINAKLSIETLTGNVYLDLGINYTAIDKIISPLSYRVKDTNFNKIDIGQFKLKSAAGAQAVFSFEARVRHYENALFKYVKILDKTGTGELVLTLSCDAATNKLKMTFEVRNFNIETSLWQDLLCLVSPIGFVTNVVVNEIVESKVDGTKINYILDMGFLPVKFISLTDSYFATENGNTFFYFRFRLKLKNLLNAIVNTVKNKGFSLQNINVPDVNTSNLIPLTMVFSRTTSPIVIPVNSVISVRDANYASLKYFVSVYLSDASWNTYGSELCVWLTRDWSDKIIDGTFNLKTFCAAYGFALPTNRYYRVKIATGDNGWKESTQLILVC